MGERRAKEADARSVAFEMTDRCIYCGGATQATTVDHCPPRAMFSQRKWPEGYVFPACAPCNAEAKDAEQWVSLLARVNSGPSLQNEEEEQALKKLGKFLLKPDVLRSMTLSAAKKRAAARRAQIAVGPGETFAELPLLAVPPDAQRAVDYFAKKIAKALHFKHTRKVVPPAASIKHRWFTNFNHIEGEVPPEIFTIPTGVPSLKRTNVKLSDQFNYLYTGSVDGTLGMYTIEFRQSFCICVMVAFEPGILDRLDDAVDQPNGANEGLLGEQS